MTDDEKATQRRPRVIGKNRNHGVARARIAQASQRYADAQSTKAEAMFAALELSRSTKKD
jgi:hypothetical protein